MQKPLVIPKINLVPKDPFYDTLAGKVMVWAIQVGRYIIVFTEIIVIMSFASRFKLDRDLTDLTARTTQKKAIVQSFGDVESRTRLMQARIADANKLLSDSTTLFYLDTLTARIPSGVTLSQLSFEPTAMSLSGKANSSNVLASMIVGLQQEDAFRAGVSVDKISSGDANDPSISFSIKLTIPGRQESPAPVGTTVSDESTTIPESTP